MAPENTVLVAYRELAAGLLALRMAVRTGVRGNDGRPRHVTIEETRAFLEGRPVARVDASAAEARVGAARTRLDEAFSNAAASGAPDPISTLAASCGLDELERDAIGVMLAIETTPVLAQVALSASDEPVESGVTPLLIAETVAAGDTAATRALLAGFCPTGVFERLGLVVRGKAPAGPDRGTLRTRIAPDPHLVERLLRGGPAGDTLRQPRMFAARTIDAPAGPAPESFIDRELADRVRTGLEIVSRKRPNAWRLSIFGPDELAAERACAVVLAGEERPLLVARASAIAGDHDVARGSLRDTLAAGAALYLERAEALFEGRDANAALALDRLTGHQGPIVFHTSRKTPDLFLHFEDLVEVRLPVTANPVVERHLSACLGGEGGDAARDVVSRFSFTQPLIEAAAAEAVARADGGKVGPAVLTAAIRHQLRTRIGDYAELVGVSQSFEDLQLPGESRQRLIELMASFRHRDKVLEEWGFGARITHAKGLTSLFHGPPGTGKTMAAGIVAHELGLEVFRVDLSRVVDKYIGETEKHLSHVFEEAERGHVLLLFDEADSLFGKRTTAGSSTDRYANMEVNYLLQRMEKYEGVVVLTTNNETLIDEAFKRRLRYRIHFPMPGLEERESIWRGLVPREAPVEGEMDFARLADQFEMSGGHIRNAMLRAAYMAAESGEALSMRMLRKAANVEYKEMGKLVREET